MHGMFGTKRCATLVLAFALALTGCAMFDKGDTDDTAEATNRDKTKKGAIGGAAAGAILGAVIGEGEADEILAGAAIGAGLGAGVGHYMDRQEDQLQEIPGASVERVSKDTVLLHMDSEVMFDEESAKLTSDARDSLDETAKVILEYPKTAVIVQGHTDDSGSEAENQRLSEQRAEAVQNYLIGRGVEEERITAVGYGAQQADEVEGADNRRVDILLKAKT